MIKFKVFIVMLTVALFVIGCTAEKSTIKDNEDINDGKNLENNFDNIDFNNGKIKELDIGIGSTKSDVEAKLKDSIQIGKDMHGHEYYQYHEYQFFFDEEQLINRIEVRPEKKYSVEDVKNTLGKPIDEGEDHSTSAWTLNYQFGEYHGVFYFNSGDMMSTYYRFYKTQ